MAPYRSLNGRSGVSCYQAGEDSITVGFRDGSFRLYTCQSTGREAVEHMKVLAAAGKGLNSYIERTVGNRHAKKWKGTCPK